VKTVEYLPVREIEKMAPLVLLPSPPELAARAP
jgi:hypothetical protein